MENYSKDFGPFDGKVWLNCAHQGVLPKVAAEEAREALQWKIAPFSLNEPKHFSEVPARLRQALGRVLQVPADEVILANSASYGLNVVATCFPWKPRDEVLVMRGDFPSCIYPWLMLEQQGVSVRLLEPKGEVLTADEIVEQCSSKSKLLCLTWVHSFSGQVIDLDAIGRVCRERGITFVVNASQGLGAQPFNAEQSLADAVVSVGFKWLCGPYGTGVCWIRPKLRKTMSRNKAYWLSSLTADDLQKEQLELALPETVEARAYDVFGTANFFNFKPWAASIEYLLDKGIAAIHEHNMELVARFVSGLDTEKYQILSPHSGMEQSSLVYFTHKDAQRNGELFELLMEKGVYFAFRKGSLRASPHLYNTAECIDRALAELNNL